MLRNKPQNKGSPSQKANLLMPSDLKKIRKDVVRTLFLYPGSSEASL